MSTLKLPAFEYREPTSIAETTALLAAYGDDANVLAGGVNLMPRMRAGRAKAGCVVNIQRVSGLDYMRRSASGGIEFGAMASLHSLERWGALITGYPAVYEAIHQITSVQSKYMGTAVGNLCVATSASDVAVVLIAYDAVLAISGPDGDRRLPLSDFYPAYARTALGRGEFVTGVEVPAVPTGHGAAFLNLVRTHADIAKVTVSTTLVLEDGICRNVRIALGSVAPTTFRALEAEAVLQGRKPTQETIGEAAVAAAAAVRPIDDIRSTAEYRKAVTQVLVGRALHKALERAVASAATESTARQGSSGTEVTQ